jgi:hypothetical protein
VTPSSFSIHVPKAGEWTFSLVDVFASGHEEHLGDSPYTYDVSEGPTDPAKCLFDRGLPSLRAGEVFRVVIETYDFHNNPTEHFDDVFRCTFDNETAVEVKRADDGTITFSQPVNVAGSHKLTVVHVPTNTEVAGSPVSVLVTPGPPNAATSTHNIEAGMKVESNFFNDKVLSIVVIPHDAFGNKVPNAEGFTVSVKGGLQELELVKDTVLTRELPIERGYAGEIELSFEYRGVEIADSPVVFSVAPVYTFV